MTKEQFEAIGRAFVKVMIADAVIILACILKEMILSMV